MQYQFSMDFIYEVASIAREIAFHMRGTSDLQSVKILQAKLYAEILELEASSSPVEEIPDLLYYACQLAIKGVRSDLDMLERSIPRYGFSQSKIEAITFAKYRMRVSGPNSKIFEAERHAIQAALQ